MTATRHDLMQWVMAALSDLGGEAHIVRIAKHIWENHEKDL